MIDVMTARAVYAAARVSAAKAGNGGATSDVIGVMPLLPGFDARAYAPGDTILWTDGLPYSAIRAVDAKTNPGWTPDAAPSEWRAWHATTPAQALPYRMRHAADAYQAGEYARWTPPEGLEGVYRCLMDGTVWNPDEMPGRWERVGAAAGGAGETPVDPAGYLPWVQPQGAHDAYSVGDRVTHGGKVWGSEVAGNVWEPGVYGWKEVIL